jgi:elongation factor P hydroxylase
MSAPEYMALPSVSDTFCCLRLQSVFDDCFSYTFRTRLFGGAKEPLYQPAQAPNDYYALYYRGDYFASALHEVAHWCIAGAERRQQLDFGYWYAPDGRSGEEQQAFESAECKPQALEWFFSQACGYRFRVSADNLDRAEDAMPDTTMFQSCVLEQALYWQRVGLPERADMFFDSLCREFGTMTSSRHLHFSLVDLS